MKILPLLPNRIRLGGIIMIVIGMISGYLYYFGGKPDFFVFRIFAIVTSYAETRYWVNAQTNLLDEFAAVLLIAGLSFLVFSKEKSEDEETGIIRTKSFLYAAYFTITVWLVSFFFVYGWAIFIFSSFIFPTYLLSNLIIFRYMIFKNRHLKQNQ